MERRILKALNDAKRPLRRAELAKRVDVPNHERKEFAITLNKLVANGTLVQRQGRYARPRRRQVTEAEIVKVTDKFGFAAPVDAEKDVFIPGRELLGSMPGDTVLIEKSSSSSGELEEGKVTRILTTKESSFAGTLVVNEFGKVAVLPDEYVKFPIEVDKKSYIDASVGDKVLAKLSHRGKRHSGHRVKIEEVFGSSDHAYVCAKAILAENEIEVEFPSAVMEQAKAIATGVGIHPKELEARVDLRDEMIFTIDGADTKDIDDAVSLVTTEQGWELGVHIADVSYYVTRQSPLDEEAFKRGTSVYYADQVIPMLPKELSNGICSLNPNEDRLAFSAIMEIRKDGTIMDYRFEKTVIRSRLQGVYSEINQILLDENPSKEILDKYEEFIPTLFQMKELAEILMEKRRQRNAMDLSSSESKIIVKDNVPVDIVQRKQEIGEKLIEEFMLCANECAATFAQKMSLPFVYRVHEAPDPDRVENLYKLLDSLGVSYQRAKSDEGVAASLDAVLDKVKGTKLETIVNYTILRTMAKAKYSATNMGHFGLALKNYAHFTSPIRRYPDLAIHRILSALLTGMRRDNIEKHFRSWVDTCGNQSSSREVAAMMAERSAEDCYKAEYMLQFVGDEIEGVISSVTNFGIFVQLPNTVEGLVSIDDFPAGNWVYDNLITYTNVVGGSKLTLGDKIKIQVVKATVATGQVDFIFAEPENYGGPPDRNSAQKRKKVSPKARKRK